MTVRPLMVVLLGLVLLLGVAAAMAAVAFQRDMRLAYERIGARGELIASPFGAIELLEGGQREATTAVLLVHGSGGGWDQGELLARAVLGKDAPLRWIAVSRFGYLRSTFKPGANG